MQREREDQERHDAAGHVEHGRFVGEEARFVGGAVGEDEGENEVRGAECGGGDLGAAELRVPLADGEDG